MIAPVGLLPLTPAEEAIGQQRLREWLIMLKWLKRWLGWDSGSSLFDFGEISAKPRPFQPSNQTPPAGNAAKPPARQAAAPPPPRKPKDRAPLDVLDNPRLTLDKPAGDGFDPYNTGAFNRSASWDKIGRQRKR